MSSRSNKKRKPRKDHTNRERTVTTLTGAPNTEYLVPIPSEEPPNFNPVTSKMQGTMPPPYPVQHSPTFQFHSGRPPGGNSTGYSAFDPMNPLQHLQSQQNSFFGPTGTQPHLQQGTQPPPANGTPARSQEPKPTPRLPPGKNDLEILENLKRVIKDGQHPFFRAVPQPAALASLYKGVIPVSDSKDGDSNEKTSTTTTRKNSEPVQVASSTVAENGSRAASVSAVSGAKLGSNERDRYSPGSQLLRELSLSANGTNGPGAPPASAGSSHDLHRDNGPPPPSSALSSASTILLDEPPRHDEPYDPTRARDYYSAPNRPPRPDSVYERPPAGYIDEDYNGYDTSEPPRRAAWGGPPLPPRDFNNHSDHDHGFDSRHPSASDSRSTVSFGPPPSFPHGVEFGGDGIPAQQRRPVRQNDNSRRLRKRRDQRLDFVDPIIERSLYIPDLAPGQTDPAELRPLIEKAREEKRKNQLGQGDAAGAQGAGAAMTTTESRPLPTGTMPTEGASTLRESEIPSAQRAAEAAAQGDDHDNDIRSSRASSGGTPRVTTFVIPASPPIIPIAGIDVPIPEKKPLSDAPDQDLPSSANDDEPIKIERPPYGRQFYGSLPPGETALDIGSLAPLFHEIQRQEENRQNALAAEAAGYAPSTSSGRGGGPPQDYPPGPDSRRQRPPQDNLPVDSGPPPAHPPARFERERERYPGPRDIRDTRDSRDASPATHVARRYPPPPPSPPGSVRGGPPPPHPQDVPDRDRDRDWQYHQGYGPGRRERWGDRWDPSESYARDYPPPPPRAAGWDPRDREYPPRDYPLGPPPIDDRDRSYAPPPPIDDRRDRPPVGPYNPPYGRVRHRSPSPPPPSRRPGGPPLDDLRPPAKRARDDYGDYYTPAPPPLPVRDLPPPHRRGAGDHYPPLPPPRAASPPHGPPPGPSSWAPPVGGGPPSDRDRDRDRDMMRDRDRDIRGRDYRPRPMEYPPPPLPHQHAHPHPHGHDGYARPRSPPHGPPPPGPTRSYGRGGYGGRGERYPPPRP